MKKITVEYSCPSCGSMNIFCVLLAFLLFLPLPGIHGQIVTYDFPSFEHNLRVTIDESECFQCESVWLDDYDCQTSIGLSYDPAGDLFGIDALGVGYTIVHLDPLTSTCTPMMSTPDGVSYQGLLAMGGGIFYTLTTLNDDVYRWDMN